MAPKITPPLNGEGLPINSSKNPLAGIDPIKGGKNDTYIQNFSVSPFVNLPAEIDKWGMEYVARYPEITQFMKDNDASLKNKPQEFVEAAVPLSASVRAIAAHEKAHKLFQTGDTMKMIQAMEIATAAREKTAIDIHPATKIGHCCFIDHGFGFVAGETAEIGDHTVILHGVTLGNFTNTNEARPERLLHRHPRIGNNCVIYTGSKILGNIQIGDNVKICPSVNLSGNQFVVKDGVTIGSSTEITSGNTIQGGIEIGEGASIGSSVKINSGNTIAKGVKIGDGAVITAYTGLINQDIPAHSQVSWDKKNKKLKIVSLEKNAETIKAAQTIIDAVASNPDIQKIIEVGKMDRRNRGIYLAPQ